mgnify:CR=1 FL=1
MLRQVGEEVSSSKSNISVFLYEFKGKVEGRVFVINQIVLVKSIIFVREFQMRFVCVLPY